MIKKANQLKLAWSKWVLKYRKCFLIGSVLLSVFILWILFRNGYIDELITFIKLEQSYKGNLYILLLGLFPLFLLWYYRNHDRREQIDKTNEQIETTTLNQVIMMISEADNNAKIKNALKLGIFLKNKTNNENIKNQIDSLTQGMNLINADLSGANLTDADLRGADLTKADLRSANLAEANLTGANLTLAKLEGAILREAKLIEANLTEANLTDADLTGTDFTGAIVECVILPRDMTFEQLKKRL